MSTGHKIDVDGVGIFYEKVGDGDKVVLLLPGVLGTSRHDFSPQLDNFENNRFTLIAWHPPGYGQSRPFERYWNEAYYRKDAYYAAELMKKLGYRRYSLLGWSSGGMTGIIIAASNPDSVEKLVVWGSNAFLTEQDKLFAEIAKNTDFLPKSMMTSFEEVYGPEFRKLWPLAISAYGRHDDICKEDLEKVRCPTLVLHGRLDPMVHFSHAQFLAERIPDCKLYRFDKGKHDVHLKFSKEFNKVVQEFLLATPNDKGLNANL